MVVSFHGAAGSVTGSFHLVHGEEGAREQLAKTLQEHGLRVEQPAIHAHYTL